MHFVNNFISITLTAYLPQVDALYYKLGYYNWLTGFASVIVGLVAMAVLLYLFYRAGKNTSKFEVVSNVYEDDGYTIIASGNTPTKSNIFKDLGAFLKSIFTKNGWKRITYELEERNAVEYIGKAQNMSGVWISLAVVCIYWLYNFIVGLI